MPGDSDKLLYTKAVKWINENPDDKSIPDEVRQNVLHFEELDSQEKIQLLSALHHLSKTNLPQEIQGAKDWLNSMTPYLDALPEHQRYLSKLGGASKRMHSLFSPRLLDTFLQSVAFGKQDKAEALFTKIYKGDAKKIQQALLYRGKLKDYSGRKFNCTAYEYAYWAKDTHMCRMLERYMDDNTKAAMAARIDEMERIDKATGQPVGLVYSQAGQGHRSAHFDFTPLKEAYRRCLDIYDAWSAASNWAAMDAAWLDVGKAQRNVPAHVAQEYCRPDRSFNPRTKFNEATLPRELTFFNWTTGRNDSWFPLTTSNSGLGFNFALIRGAACLRPVSTAGRMRRWGGGAFRVDCHPASDLAAITRLDKVRTADLTRVREHLNPPTVSHGLSM